MVQFVSPLALCFFLFFASMNDDWLVLNAFSCSAACLYLVIFTDADPFHDHIFPMKYGLKLRSWTFHFTHFPFGFRQSFFPLLSAFFMCPYFPSSVNCLQSFFATAWLIFMLVALEYLSGHWRRYIVLTKHTVSLQACCPYCCTSVRITVQTFLFSSN